MLEEQATRRPSSRTARCAAAKRLVRSALPFLVAPLVIGALPTRARAQGEANAERAQQLFSEARALMQEDRFTEACTKFAESEALDPGGGTILNLGICRRREGKSATAFALLTEARDRARQSGRSDRVATAERNLAELAPELSRLTVQLAAPSLVQGLVLELDGQPFELEQLGRPLALDPGPHQLKASQAAHESWLGSVTLDPSADSKTITVPALAASEPPAPAPIPASAFNSPALATPIPETRPPLRSAEARPEHAPRWLGVGLAAVGGVGLSAGTYFGVHALMLRSRSNRDFDGSYCTTASCQDAWQHAKSSALLSDVSLGIGAIALAAGSYLLFRPSPDARGGSALRVSVTASASDARALLRGEF